MCIRDRALDNALVLLADLNIGPELLALGLVGLGSDLVDGADDLAAGTLGDDQLEMCIRDRPYPMGTRSSSAVMARLELSMIK